MWKIHPVFYGSLIELFFKCIRDLDLNAVLNTSDPIENTCDFGLDKVMGSTYKGRRVLYLVKWKR
jgi:hypothetical protein